MVTSKKEKLIMRNGRMLWVVALVTAGIVMFTCAGAARAVTLYYTDGFRDNINPSYPVADETDLWSDPNNWNTKMDGTGTYRVPVDGDYLQFGTNGIEYVITDIDLAGVSVYLPNSSSQMNRLQYHIIDTVGGATLTLNQFTQNYSGPHSIAVPLIAQLVKTNYRVGNMTFYKTVDANELDLGNGNNYMYGDVTVTETATFRSDGGAKVYLNPHPTTLVVPTLTTPVLDVLGGNTVANMSGHVVCPQINIYDFGKYDAKIDTALGDANTSVSVTNSGVLVLSVAQADLAQITAGSFGALQGDFTGGVYGTNITLNDDAVLAVTAGPADPTEADLGLAAGTFDAKIWKAVTADGTFEYGDDGDSVWKGTAFGSYTTGDLGGKRLVAPVGSGDLEVAWLGGAPNNKDPDGFYMDSLDRTGVANIALYTYFQATNGTINQNPDANSVTTFNFTSHVAATNTMFVGYTGFIVRDDQIFNLSGPGRVNTDQDDVRGQMSFSGDIMFDLQATQFLPKATAPNVKLTFGAGVALSVGSGDVLALERLDANQIVVHPDAVLCLETSGSDKVGTLTPQFDITDANNPNLVAFMKSVNVMTYSNNNNYADMLGDGIQLGDGKYLIQNGPDHKGLKLRAHPDGNAMIRGAGPGTTMGIAATGINGNNYLYVMLPIDANGGTVLLQSADQVLRVMSGNNTRAMDDATNRLEIMAPIRNAVEVVILNTNVYISDDSVDDGPRLGAGDLLPIRVASTGYLQFRTTANEGFVVTNLDKTQIAIDQDGRVFVDGDMSVNSVVLNSTYSAGNDGLQINSSDDDLTITGKLSGEGAWGGSGQLIVAATATVAPGNGVGTLTGSNLTMAGGATYTWQVDGAGGDYDTVSVTGNVTFTGTLNFHVADLGATLTSGQEFIVMSADGAFIGTFVDDVLQDVIFNDDWTGTLTRVADGGDWNLVLSALSSGLAGDTNNDGVVDAADFITLKQNFGRTDALDAQNGNFTAGDTNVNWADLSALMGNMGGIGGAPATTPEPATLGLLALGALAVIRRRRRA